MKKLQYEKRIKKDLYQYRLKDGIDPNDTGWDQSVHTIPQPGDVQIQPGIYVPASVVPSVPINQKPLVMQSTTNYLPWLIGGGLLLALVL